MPRKRPAVDPRSCSGTNWRCPEHGDLGTDVILLSDVAYCPKDECTLRVSLSSVARTAGDYAQWRNNRLFAKRRRP